MKTTTFKTFLPLFPGFYETFLDYDEMFDSKFDELNNIRQSNGLDIIDYSGDVCTNDEYKRYNVDVSKLYVTKVNEIFNKIFNTTIKITFEDLISPKEYNFSTDSINVSININKTNLKKLNILIKEGYDYLANKVKEDYTSCSGFISSHSNDFDRWLDNEDSEFWLSSEHKVGAMLGLLFDYCDELNDLNIKDSFDSTMFDYISDNLYFDNYTKYTFEQLESFNLIDGDFVESQGYKNAFDEYVSVKSKELKFWALTQSTPMPKQLTFDEWCNKNQIDVNTYLCEHEYIN